MIKKICLFSISFGFDRQVVLSYLEKIFPEDVELFLFVPQKYQNKYLCKRAKIVETNCTKYSSFFELRKFCKRQKIERIMNLGCLPQEGFIMTFVSLLTKTDFVCHSVGNYRESFKLKLNKWRIKSFFEVLFLFPMSFFPRKMFVPSEYMKNFLGRYLLPVKDRIHRLPVTTDTNLFSPKNKMKMRSRLNLSKRKKIIIFVGRIEFLKGADIIYKLAKRNEDILFILVGKVDRALGLNFESLKNVRILDSISSEILSDYYSASDLCLLPTRLESYGIVPREAMASGIPSLTTDLDVLKPIPSMKVSKTLEIISIEKKIKSFFALPEKERKKMSKEGRKWVIKDAGEEEWRDSYINEILE